MKVLHIITSLNIGGAEKLITDSIPLYEKHQKEIDVLILKDNTTFFREELENAIRGNVYALTKKSVYNPFLIFKIIPYLNKYDIIHAHLFPVLYWAVLAKIISLSKIPIVYTEHSTSNKRRSNIVFRFIDRLIYSKISAIGCISKSAYQQLTQHLKRKTNIFIIENGINISKFKFIESSKKLFNFFPDNSFILIQISSFREPKDQPTLIKALKFLPSNIKLLLVGDGHLKQENEDLVASLSLQERVLFLGNRKDVPELLRYADISILSSDYEGFGLAAVEGMAASKPVLASNVKGLRDVVEGHGITFKKGDSQDLAIKIKNLADDKEYYNNISTRCRNRAKDFSIERMVSKYIDLYNSIIEW